MNSFCTVTFTPPSGRCSNGYIASWSHRDDMGCSLVKVLAAALGITGASGLMLHTPSHVMMVAAMRRRPPSQLFTATVGPPPPPADAGKNRGDGDGDGKPFSHFLLLVLSTMWRAYSTALERHPLLAKATTAALVGSLGDYMAQRCTRPKGSVLDVERLLAVGLDGLLVSGPGLHLGYGWLERRWPCSGGGRLRHVGLQLLIDECIFDPCFIAAFFFSTGLAERQHPIRETLPTLKRQYWPTVRGAFATSVAFTPIQFVSFRYLPVRTRVLIVNLCDVLWYAAVSLGRHVERCHSAPSVSL